MVKINVSELNLEISNIDKLITSYENNIGNLNLSFQNIKEAWHGGVFDEKIKELDERFLFNKRFVYHLKEQKKIYEEICEFYKDFGNHIRCNIDAKATIFEKFQINIESIESTKNKIQVLANTVNISNELKIINGVLNESNKVKKEIYDLFQKIEDKEYEFYNKISKNISERDG